MQHLYFVCMMSDREGEREKEYTGKKVGENEGVERG